MTDPTEAIRKALDAGPTGAKESHQSIWLQVGKCVMLNSGMPVHARIAICEYEPNASYVEACNPAAIRSLLDRLDSAERDARRYRLLRGNYLRVFMADKTGGVAFDIECEDTELGSESDGERLDAAIDAALRAGEQKEPK